ncbi:MAG: amylo-alpha-1,6-glucosidase [Firmicutes bacterium]|nr:amylo-alpha-1,6-glucosidase [Bacillota bacterium]
MAIALGPESWEDLASGLRREWLDTNGLGGFAFGTVASANARMYHGLLVAALRPPTDRTLLLAKLEEEISLGGEVYKLYCNQWASGHEEAEGLKWLRSFSLEPFPVFRYGFDGVLVEKRIFMIHGRNVTVIRYRISADRPYRLKITPLVNCRAFHHVTRDLPWRFQQEQLPGGPVSLEAYQGAPPLYLWSDKARYSPGGFWARGLRYALETARGEPDWEDHYVPGHFVMEGAGAEELTIVASADEPVTLSGNQAELAEKRRRQVVLARSPVEAPAGQRMVLGADAFLVRRDSTDSETVIAGYPWFADWGRDTMIALPGLTLVTGRFEEARGIISTFIRYSRDGLIPNLFPDFGQEPHYNSADGTLWLFQAVLKYLEYTGDLEFVEGEVYSALTDIVNHHLAGTRFNIKVDKDGLVSAGTHGVQLTWMDAKVGDWVVTPRHGKPVEVNGLWYNALRLLSALSKRFGRPDPYAELAGRTRESFEKFFWNPDRGCLFDVVTNEGSDASVRPNQIMAISLGYPVLEGERALNVVRRVAADLLTPFGLRTLAPDDPGYRGRYDGDRWHRDAAYHQGTVWPWLLGQFVTALVRVRGGGPQVREDARGLLQPLIIHLGHSGLGHISEVYDGEWPHQPGGCVAQAWSLAEILRALVEDVEAKAPPFKTILE